MKRSSKQIGVLAAAVMGAATLAQGSVWTGGAGNWSDNGNPGWNGTGIPDGIGAVATFDGTAAATTTINATSRTVGTITLSGSGNFTRQIGYSDSAGLTLNQDNAGPGYATISNTNSSTGTNNRLALNSTGTITLADDLLISNTSGSTNTTAALLITSAIAGTGNITFRNVSNNPASGAININNSSNSFTGSVLIEKGVVTISQDKSFGPIVGTINAVTLGKIGEGSATLLSTGSNNNIVNNITVASGTGGTLLLGSSHNGATDSTFSGNITLNGDLSITSVKTTGATVKFTKVISGVGSITKVGSGAVTFTAKNTYTGSTNVDEGKLILDTPSESYFKLHDANVSNRFYGDSSVEFNGTFVIDTSALSATSGTWNLVDVSNLTETFGGSFGLKFAGGSAFENKGDGLYESGDWSFRTTTGNLVLVPEPGALGLAASVMSLTLLRRRRA